jgi:hypothetical protein
MPSLPLSSLRARANVVPSAYRGVSVGSVDVPITEQVLIDRYLGREAYRRTRFIVTRDPHGATSLIQVHRDDDDPLFGPVTSIEILAMPNECAYVVDPGADTAVPTTLAEVALRDAPGTPVVVVEGRYSHVSFIVNPDPILVRVEEVVPPEPAKLADQVRRLLDVAEDLPPMKLDVHRVTFDSLASEAPSDVYLLPCRGAGVTIKGSSEFYLDERPERADWVLLGCERSRQIHEWFYGDSPAMVSMCPRQRRVETLTLAKCCLLESEIAIEESRVVVPWGASLSQVSEALREVARIGDPSWSSV